MIYRRQEMRAEIQVPEQEGVAHRSEMGRLRPTLLCSERERFGNYEREGQREFLVRLEI